MSIDDHHGAGLWRQLSGWLHSMRVPGNATRSDEGQRQSRFQIEPLEPRILLSGDPVASELARLVDDAAHATFVDDHAAIIEKVASEAVADAGHADYDARTGEVATGPVAGDERGIQWPAGWMAPETSEQSDVSNKVDLRMAIAKLIAAFAAGSEKAEGPLHFVLGLGEANRVGNSSAAGPGLKAHAANESPTPSADDSTAQSMLRDVLDQVLEAYSAASGQPGLPAGVEFKIRMAELGAGEVTRIDGTTILVDDNAGGAGWALGEQGAADLVGLSALIEAAAATAWNGPIAAPGIVGQLPDTAIIVQPAISSSVADMPREPLGGGEPIRGPPAPAGTAVAQSEAIADDETLRLAYVATSPSWASPDLEVAAPVTGIVTFAADVSETSTPVELSAAVSAPADAARLAIVDDLTAYLAASAAAASAVVVSRAGEVRRGGRLSNAEDSDVSGGDGIAASAWAPAASSEGSPDPLPQNSAELASVISASPSATDTSPANARLAGLAIHGGAPVSDADLPRGPPEGADPIRGPPDTDLLLADASSPLAGNAAPVSASDLQRLADFALSVWSNALAAQGLVLPAGSPSFEIAELADGMLGSTNGSTIRIDRDAAGRGWFVDGTPLESSEFGRVLGPARLGAAPDSASAGSMDLLTVLLHEIGHWAGYGHDAGIAVMSAVLGTGQRVPLNMGDAPPAAGGSVSGPSFAGTKVDLTSATAADPNAGITVTVNPDGSATVTGSQSDNGTLAGVTEIVGAPLGKLTLVAPDFANVWTLDGPNSGILAAGSLVPIAFTNVDVIVGGGGDDRVVVVGGATGLGSFDGNGGFDSVVNQAGAAGTTFSDVENFIDRPLLFIPGFAGSFVNPDLPDDAAGRGFLEQWYLTRGIDPSKLVLDPLSNAYSDFVQTLVNAGYIDGTNKTGVDGTLYVSVWDWRVPVAVTADGSDDGELNDVTATSIRDWATDSFDSGLDYLAYWLDKAAEAWSNLTGADATGVDVVTHSTGGLVARSYMQSAAYNNPLLNLLPVHTLIQTGVPNQGTGSSLAILANDFGLNTAIRGLGSLIDSAYELVKAGETISNPDGTTISNAPLPTELEFIGQYVATLNALLAVYPFLDTTDNGVEDLVAVAVADGGNTLLLDLNAVSPSDFVDKAATTHVVYSGAVDSPDLAILHTGFVPSLGLQNEILPFNRTIGLLPGSGDQWYQFKNSPGRGDGTVPVFSASDGFESLTNSDSTPVLFEIQASSAGAAVSHTGLLQNPYSQRQVLRLLGVDGHATAQVSTDLALDRKEQVLNLVALGLIDPVEVGLDVFSNAKDLLADIATRFDATLNLELPLIGKSLNQLLADANFDLFDMFESATAPVAGALAQVGTPAERLAQLEELLEDAFGLVDVGDPDFDNAQIEIVYDADEVTLDIVFDLNLADLSPFTLDEFDLQLDLGLSFTLGIDFSELLASAAGGSGDSGVQLSLALTGAVEIHGGPIDLSGSGSVAIDLHDLFGGSAPPVTFEVTGELNVGDAIQLGGVFGFERRTGESLMFADGSTAGNVAYTLISGRDLSGFFGVNGPFVDEATTPDAVGLSISGLEFSLLLLSHGGFDYTAFATSGGSASFVGVPDLTLGASSIDVTYNSTSDPANPNKVLDFSAAGSVTGIEVVPIVGPPLDFEGEDGALLKASGDIALDAFGFVVLVGTFDLVKQTNVAIDDGNLSFNADVLNLALTASGFVGSGASLSQDPVTDASTLTVVTTGAIGFSVPSATVDLVIVKDRAVPANKYTGLQVSLTDAGLVGIDQLGLTVSGTVQVNKGPAGGDRLDWTQVAGQGNELETATLEMDATVQFAIVNGSIALDAFGFVVLAGTFDLVKQTNVAIDDGNLSFNADVLSLSMTASVFAGIGGALSAPNSSTAAVVDPATLPGAIGFRVTGATVDLVLVKDRAVPANKYTGLQVSLTDAGLVGIDQLGLTVSGTVQVNKGPAGGDRLDWSQVTGPGNELETATLEMDATVQFAIVNGSIALDAFGFVVLAGTFDLVKQTNVAIDDGNLSFNADVLSLSMTASVFAGIGGALSAPNSSTAAVVDPATLPGAIGFRVTGATVDLVLVKDRAVPANKYTGLQVSLTDAGLVGIDQLGLTVSGTVQVNKGPAGGDRLDWTQVEGQGNELETATLEMDATVQFAIVNGSIALDAFGFVVLAGTFDLVKQTNVAIDDGNLSFNADVLSLSVTASAFAGIGGALSAPNSSTAAVVVQSGAIGFSVTGATVDLVLVKDRATPANKYTGLQVGVTAAALVGIADLGLTVSGTMQINKGPAGGDRLDWTEVTGAGKELDTVTLVMDATIQFAAAGTVWVDLYGFLQVFGDFALSKFSTTVTLAGQSTATNVDVLTFGLHDVNVFVGAGPYYNTDGTLHADSDDAIGLSLEKVSLALALFKRTAGPGSGSYYAFSAFAQDIEFVGLDDLGDGPVDASGYRIEVNGGGNGAINFAAGVGPAHDAFEVTTGPSTSVQFNYRSALQRVAIEHATLAISDYVYVSGGFSFTRQTALDVDLSGVGTDRVNVFAFGASNVDLFVGSGPYFVAGSTVPDPTAVGLALENVDFGILLMKSTNQASNKYTALKATADRVGLVGLDDLVLSASGVEVEYNSTSRSDGKVIDFSNDVYVLDTGSEELEFDYATKLLRANVDNAELQIGSYVFISGGLAFEKGPSRTVQLTSGVADVSAINVGAEDLTMFFGVDGPYWTDLNHDQIVDTGETNPNAVGLAITNANLAMTLLRPTSGNKYLALHATADQVGFVGIQAFQLSASTVVVDLNLALGAGTTNTTPVVNFVSTFPDDEYQALFNAFDGDGDGEISPDELTGAIGSGHGVVEPLTETQELIGLLNAGSAPADKVLSVTEVLGQLSDALSASELEALEDLVLAADLDGDGKFDPVGYEIGTGSGSLYLSATHRQIHASADNVLINVAQFLYVNGSVALDLGSRETVTIRSGIPASLGSLGSAAVAAINDALSDLTVGLDDLKADVSATIHNAIEQTLKGAVDGLLDDVINSIVDYLKTQLASAVGSVGALTAEQLNAAAAAIRDLATQALELVVASLSVESLLDQLIDPIMDPIIDALPVALQAPVSSLLDSLLDSIRERVLGDFGATIQQALDSALSGITASVSGAIDAALQAFAANATAGIVAAEQKVREAIEDALKPQFARVSAALDKVVAKAIAKLDPLFVPLEAITSIQVGENFSTLENVEVEVTTFGISNATAFVGLPPAAGFDFRQPLSGQVSRAVGLYVDGFNMGLGIFKPVASKKLPTFTALKLHADQAGFSDGDPTSSVLELVAEGIDVKLNLGGPLVAGPFGNATIDFVASFGAAGYAVATGTTSDPIYLDFEGEVIVASVEWAEITISEFIHIAGSFAFTKGDTAEVQVTGGLLSSLGNQAASFLASLNLPDIAINSFPVLSGGTTEVTFLTFGASNVHAFVGMNGPYWTDLDGDHQITWTDANLNGEIDPGESAEINSEAVGLVIDNFDFGLAMMRPTSPLDFARYFALRATARGIELVGVEGATVHADNLLVEVNLSSPSIYGVPLFPVVDFASTFDDDERLELFEILAGSDDVISTAEMNDALAGGYTGAAIDTVEQLVLLLNVGGAPPGVLSLDEVFDKLNDTYLDSTAAGQTETNRQRINQADADGDHKLDPIGYELNTGGTPIYLDMNSQLIRAQGFLELNLFNTIFLTGSVAFELGPTKDVTLTNGDVRNVTTMTIGAAGVTAFLGKGPYWTDTNHDRQLDSSELSNTAIGFHITNLNIGIALMVSTDLEHPGAYLAAKASVDQFGLVGINRLSATGRFDIALNVGFGASASGFSVDVIDLEESFAAEPDTGNLNADDLDRDGKRDPAGFEINTGNANAPVYLDFDAFFISIQLGGSITVYTDDAKTNPVLKLNGLFLLEADSSNLKVFVAAGLEFGPDIGSSNKFFDMNALGGLVINSAGIAADIDVSVAIGSGLSSFSFSAGAKARLVFNTTGVDQTITIPERYVQFLDGTVSLSGSWLGNALSAQGGGNVAALSVLAAGGTIDNRFTAQPDGSVTFVIFGTAPTMAALFPDASIAGGGPIAGPGPYFAVGISAHLTIGGFTLEGRFGLIITATGLQMSAEAKMALAPLNGMLLVSGSLNISNQGVVGSLVLTGNLTLGPLTIVGAFTLAVNTTSVQQTLSQYKFDFINERLETNATGQPVVEQVSIAGHTIKLSAFAKIKLTSSFVLEGRIFFTDGPSLLSLDVSMKMTFFGVELSVNGGARIVKTGDLGFVLKLGATLSANTFGMSGIFDFEAALELQINTRTGTGSDANDLGIARNTFRIDVQNAKLTLLSIITLNGSGYVEMTNGVFRMAVTLSGNFLSLVTVTASAFFSSEGEFQIVLDGHIQIGPDGFNINGSAHLDVRYLDLNGQLPFGTGSKLLMIDGLLTVGIEIFYIPISAQLGVSYNGATGDITVRAGPVPVPAIASYELDLGLLGSVTIYYPTIEWSYWTFTIGTLKVSPPPAPVLGVLNASNGVLTLNMGSEANRTARHLAGGEINEEVNIDDAGAGTTRGRQIKITMFGVSQSFDNVLEVLIADAADGDDMVLIGAGVTTKVTAHLGSGNDTLSSQGSGVVIAFGDGGDDRLKGGSGSDQLDGGAANDLLEGGLGVDQIRGGSGDDVVVWTVGDGIDTPIDGQGGLRDTFRVVGTDGADTVVISRNGSGFTLTIGSATLTVDGVEVADLFGRNGADSFTINDLVSSALQRISIGLGDDNVQDSVTVNGTASGETFGFDSEQFTRKEVRPGANPGDSVTVNVTVNLQRLVKTGGAMIEIVDATPPSGGDTLTLNAMDGADTVNVAGTIPGLATTLNGGDGDDTFGVGNRAPAVTNNVNSIAGSLTINGNSPTTGSDWLYVDDSGDTLGNIGTLTSTQVSGLGMAVPITYGTVEHVVITLGSGADTFTIESTHSGETVLSTGAGSDIVNVKSISGVTTVIGGDDSDTFNVGTNAPGANGNVNAIAALLTINGNAGTSDVLNVDDTGDSSPNTGTLTSKAITGLGMGGSIGYGTLERLNVSLGSGADIFTIDGTHGAATSSSQEDTTLNTGAGADTVNINDVTDRLSVNGQADADTLIVNGTGSASVSTLNGGSGNDVFSVLAMNGAVNVNGGDNDDVVNVGSDGPNLPGVPTTRTGTIDAINQLLTVNGGLGNDALNVNDSNPANDAKAGALTSSTIRGLALEKGIDYTALETLSAWLAFGANNFTIESTHVGQTTVYTAQGNDTVDIDGASGTVTVNAEAGDDTINVHRTGAASTAYLNGQEGADTFNLSDASHTIDAIDGLVVINGGANSDAVNVDDWANTANKAGTLTSTTLRGLEMPAGVNYTAVEDFNLRLGTGTDGLFIDSTHTGTTDVYMGDGTNLPNHRDDTVAIKSIGGVTTIHGQGGNDFFHVNVDAAANDNFHTNFKNAAAANDNDVLFNALFHRTHANGIAAVLNLHGEGGSDVYTVHLAGQDNALINVHDNGAADDGVDTLIVNGADVVAGLVNNPNDTFLLRHDLVALLNSSVPGGAFDRVERVNYDRNINARLIVNGLGGNDKLVADDNSAITTLDGGDGNDTFQIGQVFGTPRDAGAGLVGDDVFDTNAVIVGIIRDPDSAHAVGGAAPVIFDPTSFDPVFDVLPQATIDAINTAIAFQRTHGGLALDGIAYVSPGVTYATTVFGGAGEDNFSVYHNKGTLRLEGEAGNDQFVVRAFVTLDLSEQGNTEVSGGDGTDTINYAINAPVSIDGGAGFDKVVVLGTPFNDNFVVTSNGIFGAGLNVTFVNVESAELDALEGNDNIYILGTSPDIVTTVIGGLGGDTIHVGGDVTVPIVSNDLQGSSGVITQGLSSTSDGNFDNAGANGVAVSVVSAAGDGIVNFQPTGEPLRVTEDGAKASYFISLVAPNAAALAANPVYLTVSAGVVSSTDRRVGGAGVLVSADNVTFTNALVLRFDGTTAQSTFRVWVTAIDDSAAEGPGVALISHSIISNNPAYVAKPLIDIFVNVVDNDRPGVDIRHLIETAPNVFAPDTGTEVLEGASGFGFSDFYSVALTAAPAAGEVVTVKLLTDAQVSAVSKATGLTELTFTQSNWMTPQIVRVTAVDDGLDGVEFSAVRHQVTSTGGSVYSGFGDEPKLAVTVYDNETPGVVVQETNGSTVVVDNGAGDSYRVRLTSAPTGDVMLTMRTDKQTFLGSAAADFATVDQTDTKSYFEYSLKFTTANWQNWVVINVSANPNFAGTNQVLKTFPPQGQNLDRIRGPLIIEGGLGSAGADRSLQAPLLLPGETNKVSAQNGTPPSSEPGGIDTLNIFHTDNTDADVGRLHYRAVDGLGNPIANTGLALVGFEMGGDLKVNQGSANVPQYVYYGGGITYNGFEIVEVLLGKGNETLTIDDTGDRDEKDPAVTVDPATITAVHGGGGDDTINVNDRGKGPLVVYGDTSEDGIRYSNDQPAASIHGTKFGNSGADTINALAMQDQADGFVGVVIDGGPGNDVIVGSQDDDHLAGGSGNDRIHGRAGSDHVYGDSSFNLNLVFFAEDQINRLDAGEAGQLARINSMFTVPTTPTPGADQLFGDAGADIMFGDHGIISQATGTRRIETTGAVERIETTREDVGAADTIEGNLGDDILLGGQSADIIAGNEGNNIILGDHGGIDYVTTDHDRSDIDAIVSTSTTQFGGADTITAGAGQDIVIGGRFSDAINAGGGDNLVIGDSGRILAAAAGAAQLAGLSITLGTVETIEVADGGNDSIVTGGGGDIVVGGAASDDILSGAGDDIVHGDNALVDWTADGNASTLDTLTTIANNVGGSDTIRGEAGEDVLIGGAYADRIDGGSERDLIFGDNVRLDRTIGDGAANARYRTLTGAEGGQIYSTIPGTAGAVLVNSAASNIPGGGAVWEDFSIQLLDHDLATETAAGSNFGNDYIAGGAGADQIFGELGNDIIQGDGSIDLAVGATRLGDGTLSVQPSVEAVTDGSDYIEGNGGNDVIFGNLGQDEIIGGNSSLFSLVNRTQRPDGADLIFGGAGTDTARNDIGDGIHGRDADMILGDNGNIYRIVGTAGFNYDNGYGEQIAVRAAQLLDYTPGGADYNAAAQALDIGGADEIHGESGDDFVYAQVGSDVVFGEGQDDAIVGGYGNDWISAGTGDDAVLGDDGRIFASRNSTAFGEPLHGIAAIPAAQINLIVENANGGVFAITNAAGRLKYTVDLTPYSVDPSKAAPTTLMPRAANANDIIYGGLGDDALHGGAGEDAISGGEAPMISYVTNYDQAGVRIGGPIRSDYAHPVNPGNVLGYNPTTTKFALYDADEPLRKILLTPIGTLSKTGGGLEWALAFGENEGPLDARWIVGSTYPAVPTDGDDVIFGDLGHDWMVGGTGRDTVWAGWGDDLVNVDDKLTTAGGLNSGPDTNPSWEDLTYGGAGRDVLIGNTGGDRLIDWSGEFNTYVVPYNPFGEPTVSRSHAPALEEFLYALSKSQGADPTLAAQYASSVARNGEPFGELGLVRQGDAASGDQNGGPRDPQGPNAQAKRDVVSAGVQPMWQTAAGGGAAGGEAGSTGSISDSMLAPVVNEAKLRWTEMVGAGDIRLATLDRVNVQVGNLPGDRLGATFGCDIYIDSDAAGRGWQTMDLASVVMHELGHVLGFDHDDAGAIPVMNGTLDAGAHHQLGAAGNTTASFDLAGFTGADIARQAVDRQSSDASLVTPTASSALTDGLGFSTTSTVVLAVSLLDHLVGAAADESRGEAGDNSALIARNPFEATLPKRALPAQGIADVPVEVFMAAVPDALPAAAEALWLESGLLDATEKTRPAVMTEDVADLDDQMLGQTYGTAIQIDGDAAAHGWFADTPPKEFSEFADTGTVLRAQASVAGAERMHLLTALLHEIGASRRWASNTV